MLITSLKENEVFVFGSNEDGFHGAGSAGYALRGTIDYGWRTDPFFIKAIKAPIGHSDRVGKWAVYGIAKGFQEGKEGKSYAIVTIKKPGMKRSTSLREIYFQLVELWKFIKEKKEFLFIITPLGSKLAGYTQEEMSKVWKYLIEKEGLPENVKFTFSYLG